MADIITNEETNKTPVNEELQKGHWHWIWESLRKLVNSLKIVQKVLSMESTKQNKERSEKQMEKIFSILFFNVQILHTIYIFHFLNADHCKNVSIPC